MINIEKIKKYWNEELYGVLDEATISEDKLYKWTCKVCGNSFEMTPEELSKYIEPCAMCAKYMDRIDRSITSLNEDVVQYFDTTLNVEKPEHILAYDQLHEYFWRCSECGKVYKATPFRLMNKTVCDLCKTKKSLQGKSLGDVRPDLIEEWNYEKNGNLTPFHVSARSRDTVWWKCKKCGYEWKMSVKSKCNASTLTNGCLSCRAAKPKEGQSIIDVVPEIEKYWDKEKNILKLEETRPNSKRIAYWKCPDCNVEWVSPISKVYSALMNKSKYICNNCRNRNTVRKYKVKPDNSLRIKFPDIAKEWDTEKNGELTPDMVNYSSAKVVWWKCPKCGKSWEATVNSRTAKYKKDCPHCKGSNKKEESDE